MLFDCHFSGKYIKSKELASELDKREFIIDNSLDPSLVTFVQRFLPIFVNYSTIMRFTEEKSAFEFGQVNHALCAAIRYSKNMWTAITRSSAMQSLVDFKSALLSAENVILLQKILQFVQNIRQFYFCEHQGFFSFRFSKFSIYCSSDFFLGGGWGWEGYSFKVAMCQTNKSHTPKFL